MIKEKKSNKGLCKGTQQSRENKRDDYIDLFSFLLIGEVFFLYIVIFILLSCCRRADREVLAGPSLPNEAFVGTSAPCSKAELQPADPAI